MSFAQRRPCNKVANEENNMLNCEVEYIAAFKKRGGCHIWKKYGKLIKKEWIPFQQTRISFSPVLPVKAAHTALMPCRRHLSWEPIHCHPAMNGINMKTLSHISSWFQIYMQVDKNIICERLNLRMCLRRQLFPFLIICILMPFH